MGRRHTNNKRHPPLSNAKSRTNSSSLSSTPSVDQPDSASTASSAATTTDDKSSPHTDTWPITQRTEESGKQPGDAPALSHQGALPHQPYGPYRLTAVCFPCCVWPDSPYNPPKLIMPHPFLRPDNTNAINNVTWLGMVSQALPTDIAFIGAIILTEHWLAYEVLPHELWVRHFTPHPLLTPVQLGHHRPSMDEHVRRHTTTSTG